MHVRSRLLLTVSLAGVLGIVSSAAFAWGPDGHRMIGKLAMKTLPADLPAFLRTRRAAAEVGYLAPEADRERGAGRVEDAEHDAGHFVDISDDLTILGGPAIESLPETREQYDTAMRAVGSTQYKAGYLPYAIEEGFQLLAKDFALWRVDVAGQKLAKTKAERAWYAHDRVEREKIVLHDLGTWSHFVGDGSMPLHASVHYNGWGNYPNPEGFTLAKVHVPWENAYVHNNIAQADVAADMSAYRDCSCTIEAQTSAYLIATQAEVVPFYTLEKAGAFALPLPEQSSDSAQAGKPTPDGKAFTAKQLARGADELRDMIVDAWHASENGTVGYPAKKVSDIEVGKVDPYEDLSY